MVVVLLVSIIGTVVSSRVMNIEVDLTAQAEVLKVHLRHAQLRAMNTDTVWGLHCDNGSVYWLFKNGSIGEKVYLPAEEQNAIDLAATGYTLEPFTLAFDSRGIPYTDAAASAERRLKASDSEALLTLSRGTVVRTITVTPNTGFIP